MFKINSPKNSVAEILSEFQSTITQLRSLSERKAQEVQSVQIQITTLETTAAAAKEEAAKASRAADKLATFLQD